MTATYLLGAGASVEAGVPAAQAMVRKMHDSMYSGSAALRAFNAAISGLQAHNAAHLENPFAAIDVEDLYTTLRVLADRRTHQLTPFVGSWSPAVVAVEQANSIEGRPVAREIGELVSGSNRRSGSFSSSPDTFRLEQALESMLGDAIGRGAQPFRDAARHVWDSLVELAQVSELAQVQYIKPLVRQALDRPLWIASLNYDLCIELAAEELGIDVEIGVTKGPVEFPAVAPLTLAKLHGSIDWRTTANGIQRVKTPYRDPTLIFGAGNKLRVGGPFLDLLFAFRSRLDATDELHCCGYSFRDEHVNHFIDNWLMRSRDRRLFVVDPSLNVDIVEKRLMQDEFDYEARNVRRSQIAVHNKTAGDWMRDAFAPSAGGALA